MKSIRAALLQLAFVASSTGCGNAPTEKSMSIPNSNPYIQALRAVMNAQGCRAEGPNWQPTREGRATAMRRIMRTISELETDLSDVEATAREKGLENYISSGQSSFERMIAEELNLLCHPNEEEAFQRAREAIDIFRNHVNVLQPTKR